MNGSNTIPIKLVHFTNPSRFFFRNLLNEEEEIEQIRMIELTIAKYVEGLTSVYRSSMKFYQPRVGEVRGIESSNSPFIQSPTARRVLLKVRQKMDSL
jgi:hypothetical protein